MTNNQWLDQIYNTFNFFIHNANFNEITAHPQAQHLNIDPRSVASNYLTKLEVLKEQQKRRNIEEIPIPLIEIPIFDGIRGRNDGIQSKHQGTFIIGGHLGFKNNILNYYTYSICLTFSTKDPPVNLLMDLQQPEIINNTLNIDSCCLNKCRTNKRIIRRIHFDYQPEEGFKHPLHLQFGGEFPNSARSYDNLHYCLEHFLSKPRIPYEKKMDYVSLLDYMIREFDSPLDNWRIHPDWKALLDKSNELLSTIGYKNNYKASKILKYDINYQVLTFSSYYFN